ncbi:MAG: caspase family protein [Bacteroidota bacterium]
MGIKLLCIGVDHYRMRGERLTSCVNDAKDWKELFNQQFRVHEKDITILTTRRETKATNILNSIEKLVKELHDEDIGILFFSGHGAQKELRIDGAKKLVEGIRGYDSAIYENELSPILNSLKKKAKFISIIDSCHSGGFGIWDKFKEHRLKTRRNVEFKYALSENSPYKPDNLKRDKFLLPRQDNQILLAACASTQLAWGADFNGKMNGFFSYYALKKIKENSKITYTNLLNEIITVMNNDDLNSGKEKQIPEFFYGQRNLFNQPIFN